MLLALAGMKYPHNAGGQLIKFYRNPDIKKLDDNNCIVRFYRYPK